MLKVSIACLCLAALIAIVALLSGDFDETEGKVTLTTLAVAIYNLTGMAAVAVRARPGLAPIGFLGIGASAIAFVLVLVLIWQDWDDGGDESALAQAWGIASVAAISLTQAGLLLAGRHESDSNLVRGIVNVTLLAVALVAALLIVAIAREFDDDNEAGYRVLGALAVLDVLGMLLIPILRRLQRDGAEGVAAPGQVPPAPPDGALYLVSPGTLEHRLRSERDGGAELVDRGTLSDGGDFALLRGADGSAIALVERD
jgi:hypothetical protein